MSDRPGKEQDRPQFFGGRPMHEVFCRMAELSPSVTMPPARAPQPWPQGDDIDLPSTYWYRGEERSSEQFFSDTDTAALLLLHHGEIRFERYALTGGPQVPWLSMSVAKSFISALVGIAVEEGSIGSIDDALSEYVDVAPGSAYDGVAIRDVLMMSSGARWNEDYSDPDSDIFKLSAAIGGDGTLDEFVAAAVGEHPPGTMCRYNSTDTQALTSLLAMATGRTVPDYMHEKLLEPLGMVSPSHWLVDGAGRTGGFFGLNMTARDFAKLGELYRNGGLWNGNQVVPAEFVTASVTSTAEHTRHGQPWIGDHQLADGYGYQWWLPDAHSTDFAAVGVYNQFIYVSPVSSAVVVKLSSNRAYGTTAEEHTNRDDETAVFLRSIARHLG